MLELSIVKENRTGSDPINPIQSAIKAFKVSFGNKLIYNLAD